MGNCLLNPTNTNVQMVEHFDKISKHPHIIHLLNEKIPSDLFSNSLKMSCTSIA
jgi:hypothetical protein